MTGPFDLTGRVALVTGGNGGIGLGIAKGLAAAGASVAIVGRDAEKSAAALAEVKAIGGQVMAIEADITDEASVGQMTQAVVRDFGRIDILVANAGINIRKPPEDYSLEEWRAIIDTNLTGTFLCAKAVLPAFRTAGGGKIITIGSMASIFGGGIIGPYAASKGVPLASIAVPLSGIISLAGGLSIALGYRAKRGGWLIVLFLVPVTVMMHNFWAMTDPNMAQMQQIMFMKNVSMLGAALLIAHFGSGPLSVDNRT